MKRPESREFLYRSKIQLAPTSSNPPPLPINRRSSNSQNKSTNFLMGRNTTGPVYTERSHYQRPPIEHNKSQSGQRTHEYQLSEQQPSKSNGIQINKQNIRNNSENNIINDLVASIHALNERMGILQNLQRQKPQNFQSKIKIYLQSDWQKNRLPILETKLTESLKLEINSLKSEIESLKSDSKPVNKLKDDYFSQQIQSAVKQMTRQTKQIITTFKNKEFQVFKAQCARKFNNISTCLKDNAVRSIKKEIKPIIALFEISAKLFCCNSKGKKVQEVQQTYKIDKDGFLIDSDDRYLLDSRNYMIRVDQKMLKKLQDSGLIQIS